jgi:hypothetical protein
VVSDDASQDDTWDLVNAFVTAYKGPHRFVLQRHPKRVGAYANLQSVLRKATGRLHLLTDGDDISFPNRVERVATTWVQRGVSLITHDCMIGPDPYQRTRRNVEGGSTGPIPLTDAINRSWEPRMLGATFAWEAELWRSFPPYDQRRHARGGDMVLPFRAALAKGIWYIHEPLIFYRTHPGQTSQEMAQRDRTAPAPTRETALVHHLSAMAQRLRDLDRYERMQPKDPRVPDIRRSLVQATLALMKMWQEPRAALEAAGAELIWGAL